MEVLSNIIKIVFVYCTDFIINLTDLLGISYYEVNTYIFVIIWPFLSIVLIVMNIFQRVVLNRRMKKQAL